MYVSFFSSYFSNFIAGRVFKLQSARVFDHRAKTNRVFFLCRRLIKECNYIRPWFADFLKNRNSRFLLFIIFYWIVYLS